MSPAPRLQQVTVGKEEAVHPGALWLHFALGLFRVSGWGLGTGPHPTLPASLVTSMPASLALAQHRGDPNISTRLQEHLLEKGDLQACSLWSPEAGILQCSVTFRPARGTVIDTLLIEDYNFKMRISAGSR